MAGIMKDYLSLKYALRTAPDSLMRFFVSVALLFSAIDFVDSSKCKVLDGKSKGWSKGCGCRDEASGKIVSLYQLQSNSSKAGHPSEPRFQSHDNVEWYYSYNPCVQFSKFQNEVVKYPGYRPCKSVAGARWTSESTHRCDGLGTQDSAVFQTWEPDQLDNVTVSNLTVTFRNTTTKYGMQISLVCNRNVTLNESVFTYLGTFNKPEVTFFFKLESVCCCPGGCQSGYHPIKIHKGLSKKVIIGIIVGAVVFVGLFFLVICLIRRGTQSEDYSRLRTINN